MDFNNDSIDINSSKVLMQLVKNIEGPLASIVEASERVSRLNASKSLKIKPSDVIFSNSQEIADLIEEVMKLASGHNASERVPLIYTIYNSNEYVKSMCKDKINPNKISKQDTIWLIKMEDTINDNINHNELNLYDLSCQMAVSERQLYRKIKTLLHLTPNKYVRILRLYKAKKCIDDYLYDTISQISYAVGYYDTHYFSKLFKQQYDMYPKELLNARRL